MAHVISQSALQFSKVHVAQFHLASACIDIRFSHQRVAIEGGPVTCAQIIRKSGLIQELKITIDYVLQNWLCDRALYCS